MTHLDAANALTHLDAANALTHLDAANALTHLDAANASTHLDAANASTHLDAANALTPLLGNRDSAIAENTQDDDQRDALESQLKNRMSAPGSDVMKPSTAGASPTWTRLRNAALALPETYEDFPWGDRVVKVRKKIFVFLGDGMNDPRVALKLHEHAHAHALSLPGAKPTAYNLGKAGWVTIPLDGAPANLLAEWLVVSYALIAPKQLVKSLGESAPKSRP